MGQEPSLQAPPPNTIRPAAPGEIRCVIPGSSFRIHRNAAGWTNKTLLQLLVKRPELRGGAQGGGGALRLPNITRTRSAVSYRHLFPRKSNVSFKLGLCNTSEFNSPHALPLKINSSSAPFLQLCQPTGAGGGITLSLPRSKQVNKWFLSADTPPAIPGGEAGRRPAWTCFWALGCQ